MSSSSRPPAFQEVSHCEVCKCSFNIFRQRIRDFHIVETEEGIGYNAGLQFDADVR